MYILAGKFQTDCLEAMFGMYCRLSGANCHVSVQEIKESEKKLKIISILICKLNVLIIELVT